jgi:hypothetical protein
MKKSDNFNAMQWLTENKITTQSKLNENTKHNEFTALLSSLESDLKIYDGEEITYEDDDETMEITVSIYPGDRYKEITQAVNVILKKHPLFKIDKDTIDRYRDEDGVTLTFDIIKKSNKDDMQIKENNTEASELLSLLASPEIKKYMDKLSDTLEDADFMRVKKLYDGLYTELKKHE